MTAALKLQVVLQALDKATAPIRQLTQSTDSLRKSLGESQGELKRLQNAQKNLKSFEQLRIQAAQSNSAIRENQQRLAAVTREINNSAAPTKALLRERDSLAKQSATLSSRYQQERAKMAELASQLKGAGLGTGSFADRKKNLAAQIDSATQAVDRHKGALEKLSAQQKKMQGIQEFGGKLKSMGQSTALHGAAAAYGGGRLLGQAWQMAGEGMEFDATMSKVQAMARLDKDSAAMKMLRDQAKQLGAETMFSANDAAQGQAFLAIAGFTPESIHAAMPGLLDMALAGDVDLGRTADIASNILGGFGIDPSEMGRVADVLTRTFTSSNVGLESLGETMKYVGPVASAAGMELEEAAAMAGLLGNVGIQGSQAGTTLKAMLLRLSAPASSGAKAMKELGISATDSEGNLRKVTDIIGDVSKATKNMGTGQQLEYLKQIFGAEPAAGMAEIIKQSGMGGLEEYIRQVYENHGAARGTAKTMADNLTGDLAELSSAWSGLKIGVFEGQSSSLRDMIKSITGVIDKVAAWAKENPELVASIAKWGAIITGVITALGVLAITIGSGMMVVGMMIKGFVAATTVLKGFLLVGKLMLANPIFLAIALLAGAAYLIYRNWDDMVAGLKLLWEGFTSMLSGIWSTIKEAFSGGIAGVSALIINWSPLGLFYKAFSAVMDWFGVDLPAKFTEFGANLISGLVNGIKNMAGAAKEAISNVGENVTGWFKDKLGIRSPSRVFMALGGDTMDGLTLGLQAEQDGPLKQVAGLGKQLAAAGALAFAAPAMAMGGALFDSRPPISSAAPAMAPAAGDNITIHVHAAPGMDPAELARLVQQELQKHQNQQQVRRRSTLGDLD